MRNRDEALQDYIQRELGRGWHVTDEALVSHTETFAIFRVWNENDFRVVYVKYGRKFTRSTDLAALVWSRHYR